MTQFYGSHRKRLGPVTSVAPELARAFDDPTMDADLSETLRITRTVSSPAPHSTAAAWEPIHRTAHTILPLKSAPSSISAWQRPTPG